MKTIFTLIVLIFSMKELAAQVSKSSEILVVHLHSGWNKEKKVAFFTINAEPGVASASDLYQLKSVQELLPDENDPDYKKIKKERFQNINKDTIIYNYFETESSALNFIISKKWELFSITSTIVTREGGVAPNVYSNVYSVPKYLFVKAN